MPAAVKVLLASLPSALTAEAERLVIPDAREAAAVAGGKRASARASTESFFRSAS